jgi:hypothetical protein
VKAPSSCFCGLQRRSKLLSRAFVDYLTAYPVAGTIPEVQCHAAGLDNAVAFPEPDVAALRVLGPLLLSFPAASAAQAGTEYSGAAHPWGAVSAA